MTIILSEKRGVSMLKIDRHSYILNELKKIGFKTMEEDLYERGYNL